MTSFKHHSLVLNRAEESTEDALLKFTDDIQQSFDNNKIAIAIFIDLSNAFDCVNHMIYPHPSPGDNHQSTRGRSERTHCQA